MRSLALALALGLTGCGGSEEGVGRATPPAGEAPLVALAPGERALSLVADGDDLAWVRISAGGEAVVERARGGAVERVAALAPVPAEIASSTPSLLALRDGALSWIDPGARTAHVGADVPLDDEPVALALDPGGRAFVLTWSAIERVEGAATTRVAPLERRATPCRISADEAHVWFAERGAWRVARAPTSGGPVEEYADRRRLACGVHAGPERATWIEVDPTLRVFVTRFSKALLPPPDVIPAASTEVGYYSPAGFHVDLAVDGDAAFTVNEEDGKLVEVDLVHTEGRALREGLPSPTSVAATPTSIAWADQRGVWRIKR
ncbi:MAG: hypothetical protein IT374_03845 [Polyangiaceae bacterium]|nr:hypothetical protein [Polyangiaceae bacterium]